MDSGRAYNEELISEAQTRLTESERALRLLVQQLCPGVHRPAQHRDMLPPWCPACGRTEHGDYVRSKARRSGIT